MLTPKVTGILRRYARELGFAEAEIEPALRTASKARALLRKVNQRVRSGRTMDAVVKAYALRDARDVEGARKVLRDQLALAVVPHDRNILEAELERLARWKPTLKTDPPEWPAVREWVARVKAGKSLRLTSEVIATLKQAAPTVGLSDDETVKGLRTVESATALLRKMDWRIRRGANQLEDAQFRMYLLRDTGDIEGACKVMRDALAVEVVPHRRRLMEHYLEQLKRWKPPRSKQTTPGNTRKAGKATLPKSRKTRPRKTQPRKARPS